ncbi:MAG TPA: acetyl-CoA carboxylase carboxyltransferase subunit alpha [Isosphaeraceae bacterium]|nr:acetyl-CoA carboxylase carboxyltransferase subunit alpha [Isosphaeraceae bacterium]
MSTSTLNRYRLPFENQQRLPELESHLAELEARYASAKAGQEPALAEIAEQVRGLRRELIGLTRKIYANLTPWETVQVSRCDARPQTRDYIGLIFDQFVELHGDRAVGDDAAVVTGFAHLGEQKLLLVGHQKGKTLSERQGTNFGCAHPEGYRKALKNMKLAEKLGLPIVCLIDTPGAYPGIKAEERGQALVIAENLMEMSRIDTPIVCVVIGEGGSGGALGIGIGDKVAMLEHSYYSVISPEGCATILWKGAEHAERAASALRMTSRDLHRMGIIDEVILEPLGGAHRDHREAGVNLKAYLLRALREIAEIPRDRLLDHRYAKFRNLGMFFEGEPTQNGLAAEIEPASS